MADCDNCSERNPSTPVYSQAAPIINDCQGGCSGGGNQIVQPPVDQNIGKTTEIIAGFAIAVTDLSDSLVDRFRIDYQQYENVSVNLIITALANSVAKSLPILKGTIIDEVQAIWTYNAARDGDINTQTLDLIPGGSDPDPANPSLGAGDRNHDYTSLAVTEDASVQVQGGDGQTSDSDTENITFGNHLAIGVYTNLLFESPNDIQTIFNTLASKQVKRTQNNESFDAYGASDEHMVIMYPKAWGESAFTKGIFSGGYYRLKKVTRLGSPVFTVTLQGGEVEEDITISNNNPDGAHSEEYYIYMSEYPARTGEIPTIITAI